MITGEVERIMGRPLSKDDFDPFLGNKKKRQARRLRRKARRSARRLKRQQQGGSFFSKIGQTYREAGGATGIGTAIDSITNPKYDGNDGTNTDGDFSIGGYDSDADKNDNEGLPTLVFVLGGVVVLGIAGIVLLNKRKQR